DDLKGKRTPFSDENSETDSGPCQRFDLAFDWTDFSRADYEEQFQNYFECLAQGNRHQDLVERLEWLKHQKTESGLNFFQYPVLQIKDLLLELHPEHRAFLLEGVLPAIRDGR